MWNLVPGIALSLLPRRWRTAVPEETVPWVAAAILSGVLEAVLAVAGLVAWYSHSVTTWAADALDSALRNGPAAAYDPHLLGLSAFVIWCIHPLTWLLASFFVEGLVRMVAAISLEQILPMWLLASADWFYGKVTRRPRERDVADLPGGREQLRSFLKTAKFAAKTVRLRELPDELTESTDGARSILEIRSSRQKADWTPPRVVRVDDIYYRLESVCEGQRPRPFVYRLRRLAAGVPGRNVILYHSPRVRAHADAREPA
jgi:hypothetical protein